MSTFGMSPMIVTGRDATSSARCSAAKPKPSVASARRTRSAFATVGSIRMSMSRVARVVPQSCIATAPKTM
jgi:hypothetical protein